MSRTRQLAAIMFTDIVGYSTVMEEDEEQAFRLLKKNREIQKPIIEMYNGKWLKEIGDGVLSSFSTVSDAVNCAIDIQAAAGKEPDLKLRVGIHHGEVVFEGGDVFGSGVNIASRIQAAAEPNCIYTSESVYNNVSNNKEITTRFVKEALLKNLKHPVKIYEVLNRKGQDKASSQEDNSWAYNSSYEKSIAVLPFVNMSNDPEQDYFCDGITEELIDTLTMSGGLRVIARTSAFAFKNKFDDIGEIGRKLKVNYILEGSIRKFADKIRLNAKLINVSSSDHLWSAKFDRDLTDIFLIQEEIAVAISDRLKVLLQDKHLKPPTQNMESFNYYLMGRHASAEGGAQWEKRSIDLYKIAISKDPRFASAHAALAWAYLSLEMEANEKNGEKIFKHAGLALQFDSANAEAHAAIALSRYHNEWKWKEAEKEYLSAMQLNPSSVTALHSFGLFLGNMNRGYEALNLLKKALEIDPFNVVVNQALGGCYNLARNFKMAKAQSELTLQMEPSNILAKINLALSLIELQEYLEAKRILNVIPEDNPFVHTFLVYLNAVDGNLNEAKNMIDSLGLIQMEIPCHIAWMKLAVHDYEDAFKWLNLAVENRDIFLISLPSFCWWDPIRNNPRFDEVMNKIGLTKYLDSYSPIPF